MVIFGVGGAKSSPLAPIYPFFIDFIDPRKPDPVPGPYFLPFLSIFLDFRVFGVFLPKYRFLGSGPVPDPGLPSR